MTSYQGVSTNYVLLGKMQRNAKKLKLLVVDVFDDIIFICIVFYFKNYLKKYFLNFAFFCIFSVMT